MTIILPLPKRILSANKPPLTAGGRMARSAATKKYRNLARDAAQAMALESIPWAMGVAKLVFFWPDARRRDFRNAEGCMKAAYDGVVDAGVLVDDDSKHLTHEPTEFRIDAKAPRVELTITNNG